MKPVIKNERAREIAAAVGRPELDLSNTKVAFAPKSDGQLRHTARLLGMMAKPWLVNLGSTLGLYAVKWNLPFAKTITRKTIYQQFVGGRTLEESTAAIEKLYEYGVKSVLDYGAEAKETEADFDQTRDECIRALEYAAAQASAEVVSTKVSGMARFSLLESVQANGGAPAEADREEFQRVKDRLQTLCKVAEQYKVRLFFDAEETWIQNTIDQLVIELMEQFNVAEVLVYNTYQMYRHDRLAFLKANHEEARRKGYLLGAKLVRGAYMEKERERATERGYPSPIQPDKASSDRDFDAALRYCADHYSTIGLCNGSHNMTSAYLLARLIDERNIARNHPHLMFCQLYGMSDNLTFNLAAAGFNAAKYMPYGPVSDMVPYLVRRSQENTSVTGEMGRELTLVNQELKRRAQHK